MHEPGHSGRGSGVVVPSGNSCGFGFRVVIRVLSQHIEPFLQLDVCGIRTEGLSQKRAIIFERQKPGQMGPESRVTGLGLDVMVEWDGGDISSFGCKMSCTLNKKNVFLYYLN